MESQLAMLLFFFVILTAASCEQLRDGPVKSPVNNRCRCMEYWECLRSNGNFSSYCGLDESDVCCRTPRGGVTSARSLQSRCGRKGKDSGRIGFAEPSEWPWHAAILEKANHIYICGASLIDENWVLTAAHCIDDFTDSLKTLTVRLGEYDIRSNAEFHRHEEHDISEGVVHPGYGGRARRLQHDVALLRLRFPVQRRPHVDVVCVPRPGMRLDHKRTCFVTGWGRRSAAQHHSPVLKEVPVPIWPRVRCENTLKEHFGKEYQLPEGLVCAGSEGNDACDGDGGGPLVCEDAGQWYQVGIVSFGLGCGEKDTPGVYTKVIEYEPWIRDTIQSYHKQN